MWVTTIHAGSGRTAAVTISATTTITQISMTRREAPGLCCNNPMVKTSVMIETAARMTP